MTSKTMKIGRPRQLYKGHLDRTFVPIDLREDNGTRVYIPKKSDYYNIPYL